MLGDVSHRGWGKSLAANPKLQVPAGWGAEENGVSKGSTVAGQTHRLWCPDSSGVSLWHSGGTAKCTLGGKDKFNLTLEWVLMEIPHRKGKGTELYFFSLGVKPPFTSEELLSCRSVGDLHTAHVIFCSEVTGQVSTVSTSWFEEYKPLIGFHQLLSGCLRTKLSLGFTSRDPISPGPPHQGAPPGTTANFPPSPPGA